MCAIVGIIDSSPVNQTLYDAMIMLQHRGQDAAGIMTSDPDATVHSYKNNGLVQDVFKTKQMQDLTGMIGIGHCRYPTAGCDSASEAQPFFVSSPFGIGLAHNGNITNAVQLKKELFEKKHRHVSTTSDSEVLLNVLADNLEVVDSVKMTPDDLFNAVARLHEIVRGAYTFVAMIAGYGVLGVRDPFGIRPLVIGQRETPEKINYMIASESVALEALGFKFIRDVEPGEAVFIDKYGNFSAKQCAKNPRLVPCAFEYVYFARPDSVMNSISVYDSRVLMGNKLAENIKKNYQDVLKQIDVVMPVPDSGRTAALQLSKNLNIEYSGGLVKNRYIGRTFIMSSQAERRNSVHKKLNTINSQFKGRNVLLVDDSLVRGNTSRKLIEMARAAGASKVFFATAAPPIISPNVYGIDMPTREEMVAHNRTEEQVAEHIGADAMIYQKVDDLRDSIIDLNPKIKQLDMSCFTGEYVTGDIDDAYLEHLNQIRGELAAKKKQSEVLIVNG
ncbi:amidophosphoribosyltransferase [Candidatus Saccharibacteria bacterium]|nr:amidophosphoribosyltransferase [Candidatus Saccharibacteria bacterium]